MIVVYCFLLDGVPFDGIPKEELQVLHVSVTITFVVLSTAGIAFAIFCIVFNYIFRKKK